MPKKTGNSAGPAMVDNMTLEAAIAEDAYEWMMANSPRLLFAIQHELQRGKNPDQVRMVVSNSVGPERQSVALRCYQAARWLAGEFDEAA
jgi:hypothetical protein